MWLYFLHKVRWAMIPLAVFMIVAGIVMLVRDVGDVIGWALIFFGVLQCVLQYSFWKHSQETDPIDTIM